jgi:hypothetical protein
VAKSPGSARPQISKPLKIKYRKLKGMIKAQPKGEASNSVRKDISDVTAISGIPVKRKCLT